MDFSTKLASAETAKADCVAVGIYADGDLTPAARRIDLASKGALRAAIKSGDATGKRGTTLLLRALAGVAAPRVLLVGLGKREEFGDKAFGEAVRAAARGAGAGTRELAIAATDWVVKAGNGARDGAWQARQLAIAARETVFRSDELKSKKDDNATGPAHVLLLLEKRDAAVERGLQEGVAIANGMALTKRLGNLPPNVCTPTFLGEQARKLAKEFKLGVDVFDRRQIEKLGMGAFLSVTRGSAEPPRLIVVKYNGAGKAAPVALVGKGITFDSGGISLKPSGRMDEMKGDMAGGAAVLCGLGAIAELAVPVSALAVVPACENMPSGTATRPGDIVTALDGTTIEVTNTDAEGRMVLADALVWARRNGATHLVDLATLTGAVVVALGDFYAGLLGNDDAWIAEVRAAAEESGDHAWPLPLHETYRRYIRSPYADRKNSSDLRQAGPIYAASFLKEFAGDGPWAHLDIAGTASLERSRGDYYTGKGATGYGVRLLVALAERAAA